jgi:hypothetical protein
MKTIPTFFVAILFAFSVSNSNSQNIFLTEVTEAAKPELKFKAGSPVIDAAVVDYLRKLNRSSAVMDLISPSYPLSQADWDTMSEKYVSAFPKDYSFVTMKLQRTLLDEKGRVIKVTCGRVNGNKTITAYSQVVILLDSASSHSQIIKIKVNTSNEIPEIKLTESEFESFKEKVESYKKAMKSLDKPYLLQ